jgi:hypothetical protein
MQKIGYSDTTSQNALYKRKYLKYKAKYLQLEKMHSGGDWASIKQRMSKAVSSASSSITAAVLPNAVVLTNLQTISPLLAGISDDAKFGKPISVACTDFENLIKGRSHILLKNSSKFREFVIPTDAEKVEGKYKDTNLYSTTPLCGKTQISETTKDVGRQVQTSAKEIGKQLGEATKEIREDLKKQALVAAKQIKEQAVSTAREASKQLGQELSEATKKASQDIGRKMSTSASEMVKKTSQVLNNKIGQKGGAVAEDIVKETIRELWGAKNITDFDFLNKNKYDVVIKYVPGTPKSTMTIKKLN